MLLQKFQWRYLVILLGILASFQDINAQEKTIINGTIYDQSTGDPIEQVMITLFNALPTEAGIWAITDVEGKFKLELSNTQQILNIQFPGYHTKQFYLYGRTTLNIYMVNSKLKSLDDIVPTVVGEIKSRDFVNSIDYITSNDVRHSLTTSFDQELQGKLTGLNVVSHSGIPGHRSFMSIRGTSSFVGRNEPLYVIDGMIHESNYGNTSAINGFTLNPMDLLDIVDVASITVQKDAQSILGAKASNGIIYVNTEEDKETSTEIKFEYQGGLSTMPTRLDLLNSSEFGNFLNDQLLGQNLAQTQIDEMYPWLHGGTDAVDYYRYNNETDWQDEIFTTGYLQKYHFYLKGGDEIATYNISTGYVKHQGIMENTSYSRYNLRLNGIINITEKFSIIPNAKLGLADNKLQEQGSNHVTNPILAAQLKPPIMAPNSNNVSTGEELGFLDDVGAFNLSNPAAIISNLNAENRNFHFLSSAKAKYEFSKNLSLSSSVGMDYNNSRDNIFIPDVGLAKIDSASNSVRVMMTEFQSLQSHTHLNYANIFNRKHSISVVLGLWGMKNSYEFDMGTDLNSPTDDFTSLGQGAEDQFLRTSTGSNRNLNWVSYYTSINYSYLGKYYINSGISYDGTSALNEQNRYNLYPSVGGAWRLSGERFMSSVSWIDDLKLRGSYGITGNTYSSVYDFSTLYYVGRRIGEMGVLVRESIPNPDMELEKKSTIDLGLDLLIMKEKVGLQLGVYQSKVDNLIIRQNMDEAYGFTDYFDNGGEITLSGVEVGLDTRLSFGKVKWNAGLTASSQMNTITNLTFLLDDGKDYFLSTIEGAELVSKVDNPMYAFWGFETNGVYSADEAGTVIGPNGILNEAGDIRFLDNGDGIINDEDKKIIGDPNPKLFGGFFNTFYYKNFSLELNFTYYMGNDLYNYVRMRGESMDELSNQQASVKDRWTPGSDSEMPRNNYGDNYGNSSFSDRWIEDGSYLRLKQLVLAYTFDKPSKVYKNLMVYGTATNLLTLTGYSGYNPEFMYNNNPEYMGVDYGLVPHPRSFIVGIKLGL